MDILFGVVVLIVAIIIFRAINKVFNITYFGFKGLASFFFGCVIAAYFIVAFSAKLIVEHYIWFIVAAVIIAVFTILIKIKRNKAARQAEFTVPEQE
jgi:sugar phosphate permease